VLDTKGAVHLHEDDLDLYANGRLEAELLPAIENHLLACEICRKSLADCLRLGLALQLIQGTKSEGRQRRVEPRFSTVDETTLQALHPLSAERHRVKIVNVSKDGLGILSAKSVLPGTIVQLRIGSAVELGNVRYCLALEDGGFRIGVRLHGEG
jgi:hypothetical protein